jgi:prepilin-type N-terminal cleavage/methylation domain-containing protein
MTARPTCKRLVGEDGFTLIEALVALALGALVVTLTLSAVQVAGSVLKGLHSRITAAESLARTGAILAQDTLHALRWRDTSGNLIFLGTADAAIFAQSARPTAPWRGASLVRLSVERDRVGGISLYRSEAPLDAAGPGQWQAPVLLRRAPDIVGLRYLDADGRWQFDWSETGMPRAIAVALAPEGAIPALVAEFPPLIEPDCALGQPNRCSLPPEMLQ